MKKIISLFLGMITLSMLLLSGCGEAPKAESTDPASAPDIKAIKDRGTLKIGVKLDVPKFGFKNPTTGQVEGMEIDLSKALAKKILGDENKIDVQGVTAKTRGPLLDNGEVDLVIATFTITDERKQSYNFSDPYFTDGVGLLVKKSSGIQSLQDLNGKKIGVAQSATSKKAIQDAADKAGIKISFLEFGTYPEIKAALDSGRVDCFSVDGAILFGYLDDSTVILNDRYDPQKYGVASKKSNVALAKIVNDTINEMKQSGELDKLIQKWGLK
ncbi:putative glutamine transport system substrate-binding protein [Sporomusaceae bacterium BoRhaA]|uniref:transporter substrate-binding domain-containing protein n=1 Tax=Pelorhabdus rhamnosifermentans TaxID=2772457 RepID=UPI001C0612E7|nr:transporter substrate-binding domain-containing protein [Pelorhabdus rhamnosifermentans]MBU2702823.1 putative glutamine transport system substrate-binding protein [Pelorhabdus rhamnosifermentans]